MREEAGPNAIDEWQGLRTAAESVPSSAGREDLMRIHAAGYFILDRSRRPGPALEELELYLSYKEPVSQEAKFHRVNQLLNYAAYYAAAEAKSVKYIEELMSLKLRARRLRRYRAESLTSLLGSECPISLPDALVDRIKDVANGDLTRSEEKITISDP